MRPLPRPSIVEWFCLGAGILLTLRYGWLLDDAFVYFRYADNLVHLGFGLVYNAGEYVEGYTSPLWMLLVAGLRRIGAEWWQMVQALGVSMFAVTWAMAVRINREMSLPGAPVVNLPLCFLTLNYAVLSYFTSGIETPLVQLSAAVYALFLLRPGSTTLQILVAATPLVRPELALAAAAAWVYSWVRARRVPMRMAVAGAGFSGAWLLFRVYYYADLLPNTYYLKSETAWGQGWRYILDTALPYGLPIFLALSAAALYLGHRRREDDDLRRPLQMPARLAMLGIALLVAIWVMRLGGDPRHYRYLAFPFCLAVLASGGSAERLLDTLPLRWATPLAPLLSLAMATAALASSPRQLADHPLSSGGRFRQVDDINDAAYHRARIAIPPAEQRLRYAAFLPPDRSNPYTGVHTDGWCETHYKLFDQRIVHGLGLTDAILARTVVPTRRPGHKRRLLPLGRDLARLLRNAGNGPPTAELFEEAVRRGEAPAWIVDDLDAISAIARKVSGRRDFLDSMARALTFPRVTPGPEAWSNRDRGGSDGTPDDAPGRSRGNNPPGSAEVP